METTSCELCSSSIDKLELNDGDVIVVTTEEKPTQQLIKSLSSMSKKLKHKNPIIILDKEINIEAMKDKAAIGRIEATITKYKYILDLLKK